MNHFRHPAAGLVLATIGGSAAFGASGSENPCQYEESRPISFLSWEDAETASVRIIGNACADSVVIVTIASAEDSSVFSHAAVMEALTAAPTNELGAADARSIANLVWSSLGPMRTSELQPWKEPQEIYDLFDEIPLLERDEYEEARKSDRPYVCVQDYYEGADCYWNNPNSGIQKLIRLSD